ncbi:SUMO-specific isopeptidase USPL1-like isoform X2 [Entelurus aequoreus]|uniref:SUMO-specific isopeptidase USPL1-like isoform X2 n=1 Tax=Entelurus aequoreus TaxID=161455 RepID=UPI002B1E430A|nr:SUMO-specific isopeptidase USPL1-like isoform X2 [Entelurus aequoreus]
MVILVEMQRLDLGTSGGIPMTGDSADTGLGARASPLVGYLGKVQERAASLDTCPWCAARGLSSPLRSYRVNLHESITLCTDPQCLFPLVSRPLEDILASLVPAAQSRKRAATALEEEEREEEVKAKHLRSIDPPPVADVNNTESGALNGRHEAQSEAETQPCSDSPLGLEPVEDGAVLESSDSTSGSMQAPSGEEAASLQQGARSEGEAADLVSVPEDLFWRNAHNLCWLDVLLVVLVHCRGLRRWKVPQEPQRAAVWRLLGRYDDACAALRARQQTGSDGSAMAPRDALQHADEHLRRLRASIFDSLQSKLHCRLGEGVDSHGQMESPVFALPLLLASDSWAEPLFQTTFHWELQCAQCQTVTRQKVTKTLATFTNILPDWHPLHARHLAPCNVCQAKNQRRSMRLESLSAVLALHFVEGLAHGDVTQLAFTFKGRSHAVTAVVQYDQHAKHFVTWTRRPDGSWLESDDLKHPHCGVHPTLRVPAQEIHMVFWEAAADHPEPAACSPSSTSLLSPPPDEVLDVVDLSMDSTTLLDTFEGLLEDEITLTLTEVNEDPETDLPAVDPAPDSSALLSEEAAPQTAAAAQPSPEKAPKRSRRLYKQEVPVSPPSQEVNAAPAPEQRASPVSSSDSRPPSWQQDSRSSLLSPPPDDVSDVVDLALGSTTLLDTFEGLLEDEITLTLTEVNEEPETDLPAVDPAPDSSALLSEEAAPQTAAAAQPSPEKAPKRSRRLYKQEVPVSPPSQEVNAAPAPEQRASPVSSSDSRPPSWQQDPRSSLLSPPPDDVVELALGSTTLLDTFEGLLEDEITLTLTEVEPETDLPAADPAPDSSALLSEEAAPQSAADTAQPSPEKAPKRSRRLFKQEVPVSPPAAFTSNAAPAPEQRASPVSSSDSRPPSWQQDPRCSYLLSKHFNPTTRLQHGPQAPPLVQKAPLCTQDSGDLLLKAAERFCAFGQRAQAPPLPPAPSLHEDQRKFPVDTATLRYQLCKKLKAKKKKLAKLNRALCRQGAARPQPDSTRLGSPGAGAVTSSTYDHATHDTFLSPHNLSPDSSGFPHTLAGQQDGGGELADVTPHQENFLDEFLAMSAQPMPLEAEAEVLRDLELFCGQGLVDWCRTNNLVLNVDKTKEIMVDFRKHQSSHTPLFITGTAVETCHVLQRHYIVWTGTCKASDWKSLQRVARTAEKITRTPLPPIQEMAKSCCLTRAQKICRDASLTHQGLFSLLDSRRRFCNSFFPQAVRLLNAS